MDENSTNNYSSFVVWLLLFNLYEFENFDILISELESEGFLFDFFVNDEGYYTLLKYKKKN